MIGCLVNPLFLFLTVWGCATVFYLAGVSAGVFLRAEPLVVAMVLLNVATFALGYLTWSLFLGLRPPDTSLALAGSAPMTPARLRRCLRLSLAFGAAAFILCAARLVIVSNAYGVKLAVLLSNPALWRRFLTTHIVENVYVTQLSTMAISISCAMFSIGFVLLGVHLYFGGRRRYLYLLPFLGLALGMSLLNLSRKEIAVNMPFLALSYILMHAAYRVRPARQVLIDLLAPVVPLLLLFILVELLLAKGRAFNPQDRIAGFLFSLYWYIASPVAAFGEYLANHGHEYRLGQSLFFPIYKWLHRLHLVDGSQMTPFGKKVYIPYVANVYSYLRNIHEDFGVFGVAIVPYVLGWAVAAVRPKAPINFGYLNLYLILLVLIIFSFYNYLLVSNQFYLQAAFALLFLRFDLRALRDAHLEGV